MNSSERRFEIAAHLKEVHSAIEDSCRRHGRSPVDVTLIAVTKTFPADDVRHLAALGVADVGENRDQEARAKHEDCRDLPLRWHVIGQLQRNKARSVVSYAHMVHSVDRSSLVDALNNAARDVSRVLPVLLQIDLESGRDHQRGGVPEADLVALAELVSNSGALQLSGLMAVAPLHEDPYAAFARLAHIRERFLEQFPHAALLSAGMSHDLDAAIAHGATHVRIGSALLGSRPPVV